MADSRQYVVRPGRAPLRTSGGSDDESSCTRTIVAALVAGGLALGASLYPTPSQSLSIGSLDSPGIERAYGSPESTRSASMKRVVDFGDIDLPALLAVSKFLVESPGAVSVETLLNLTDTTWFRDVVDTIEGISVSESEKHYFSATFAALRGGGGGGGGSSAALPTTLQDWAMFLNLLLYRLPSYVFDRLSGAIAKALPGFIDPFGIERLEASLSAMIAPPPVVVPNPTAETVVAALIESPAIGTSTQISIAPPAPPASPAPPAPPDPIPVEIPSTPTSYEPPPTVDTSQSEAPTPSSPDPTPEETPSTETTDAPEIDDTELEHGDEENDSEEDDGPGTQGGSGSGGEESESGGSAGPTGSDGDGGHTATGSDGNGSSPSDNSADGQ